MTTPFSTAQGDNPFAVAVSPASVFPKMTQLDGILILAKPVKTEMVYESVKFVQPGSQPRLVERMSVDVETIDHIPAGFQENVFPAMYINGSRLITQLRDALATGKPVLGRISKFKPNEPAGAGNPWGLLEPTPEDVQLALRYVNGTHRPQPSVAPVQAASNSPADVHLANQINQAVQQQQQYQVAGNGGFTVQQPSQAPAPQYQAPVQQQPLHQGTNPFA